MATTKMVRPPRNPIDGGEDAFVQVQLQAGALADLPPYLLVSSTGVQADREHFTILEGHHEGKPGSVKVAGGPYLAPPQGHQGGALVQFLPGKKKLRIANMPSLEEVEAIVQEGRHLDARLHELFIPEKAHAHGEGYVQAGAYRKVWFGIHTSTGPNFLHAGKFSAGCLAMTDIAKWPALCSHLVRCRDGNRKVGTLNVCRPTAEDWCMLFNNNYRREHSRFHGDWCTNYLGAWCHSWCLSAPRLDIMRAAHVGVACGRRSAMTLTEPLPERAPSFWDCAHYRLASLGGETIVTITCRAISDVCIEVEGYSPPPVNFRLSGVLPIRDGNMCQTFIPETPGGGVMQGTWNERNGNHAQGHAGHVRLGVWTPGAVSPDLHAPVRIQFKGSVSRGLWGKPGTTKIEAVFDAMEPRERPWHDFPWNPGYPWDATPA